ncbi:oligosaccharide flippase family protein [Lactobacillus corticis]|uniref:Flippase n=1 Tax=Lactobacillus corticis TaxID=2201249 RepID=A0A916QF73_9LACO|nr:oligosaccharide flippase family protein [Lactobacillus corticis]GFZ26180.1 flippase [Lactobacillus corticis]
MRVIKNYLYNASYQLLAIILPLITSPYISRVLGPRGYGDYSFTFSIINWFTLIASIGVAYYGDRQIAYVRKDRYKMSKTFWEIQSVKFAMTLITLVIFAIFTQLYGKYYFLLWLQSVNIIAGMFDISWLYVGIEDFKRTVTRNTLVKLVSFISIFVFVRHAGDTWIYILINAFSLLLGNLTLWPTLKRLLVPVNVKDLRPLKHLKESIVLFIPSVATKLYSTLNKTVVGVVVGATATGFYNNSDQIVQAILAIVTATGTVILPKASNEFAKGNHEKVKEILYRSFDFVSLIAIPMAFGLAAISLKLAPFFYGRKFAPVGPVMMIEAINIVLIAWSNAIGIQYLLPVKRTNDFTKTLVAAAVFSTIAIYPFTKIFGLKGGMAVTVLSEAVVTSYQLYMVRHDLHFVRLFQDFFKYLISGVVMFAIVFYLNNLWTFNLFTMVIEVLIGVIVYAIMIIITRPKILFYAKEIIKKRK